MFLALLACTGDDPEPGDSDTNADEKPVIVEVVRVECEPQQSASDTWSMEVTVDDPQGADTVDEGTYDVVDLVAAVLYDGIIVCDDAGSCFGSFRQALSGIGCDMGGEIALRFQVVDADGNLSETVTHGTSG